MQQGDIVEVAAFGQEHILRMVVAVRRSIVEVCRENDYEAVKRGATHRTVGFPIADVIRVVDQPRGA